MGLLLITYPNLLKEWDYENNNKCGFNLNQLTDGSGKKSWWKCSKGHSWQAKIADRTKKNTGCPYCSGYKATNNNNLLVKFPSLIKEWDFSKNIIKPDEVTSKSNKKVWWKCSNEHSWEARIDDRTCHKQNCPICAGQKIVTGVNDLLTLEPELCKEWDYEKNDKLKIYPNQIACKSGKKVWWKCANGHSYQVRIDDKTFRCPICSNNKTSFGEQSIYYYLKDYRAINQYKYQKKEIDIYLPNENIGIEFNGLYWHKNRSKYDQMKEQFFINNGIKMYYICESDQNKIENNKIYFNSKSSHNQYSINLEWSIKELFKLLNFNINVNIENDKKNIYKQWK